MRKSLLILMLCVFAATVASAQCNMFTKKKCIPSLTPYIHNGQLNSASLGVGETAELELTFYAGQEYRILVCGQEIFKEVKFKLKDKNDKEIFNSEGKEESYWDFKVNSTQQLKLELTTVGDGKNTSGIVESGCVSVLVGFKKQ
jgi:hypothetical protein